MKISKTLFKNLIRCPIFPAIYDMYINRAYHHKIDFENNDENALLNDLSECLDLNFENEIEQEIFDNLFDSETGEDLTITTSAQLEAFQDIFVEVERLAIEQAKRIFNCDIIASTDTYQQQYFEYADNEYTYYCYLDGYYQQNKEAKVWEVKATTSRDFDQASLKIKKTKNHQGQELPLFKKGDDGITYFIGYEYVGLEYDDVVITKEMIDQKVDRLCDMYSKTGKYIYDLAIERYIVENATSNEDLNIRYYLIILNSNYTKEDNELNYPTDSLGNDLFKIYDLTEITALIQPNVISQKNKFEYNSRQLHFNRHSFSNSCQYKKTMQCKFFNVCGKCLKQDGSILEYIDKKYAFIDKDKTQKEYISIYDLINDGRYSIVSAHPYIYKKENLIQYHCVVDDQEYIDKERIKQALSLIEYPIYHLDFESYNSPLPRFKGEHPYTQSLFQYSLHIEKTPGCCDIVNNHYEYLAPDHQDHREDLVVSLINNIDLTNGGTVMVYNQTFEKTRLKELSEIFPKYKQQLDNINNHVYDLYTVLSGKGKIYKDIYDEKTLKNLPRFAYYNKNLHGSFSIKKVLPIFTNLSYQDLDVQNGTEAILTYGLLPTLTQEEYEKKYLALRIYCRQDTWAMVEILRGLREKIDK